MRTTLDLPDGLLERARRACGARTKTMTVVMALQQLVNAAKIEQLR
ncbi:MAG: type II toxin-antitoxin system VapB family antitoxin, partial [Candidatus Methylomirabilales bacterium]